MPDRASRAVLSRLANTIVVLAVVASGALAQAMPAGRCPVACESPPAVRVDACCAGDASPAPAERQAPRGDDREDHDAGCCPTACQGCGAVRPLIAAASAGLPAGEPPLPLAPPPPAAAVDPLDVAFAIFHPPRA